MILEEETSRGVATLLRLFLNSVGFQDHDQILNIRYSLLEVKRIINLQKQNIFGSRCGRKPTWSAHYKTMFHVKQSPSYEPL